MRAVARSRRTRSRLGLVALVAAWAALLPAAAHGADRIYWGNERSNTIAFANPDGSGAGGTLNTTGATLASPFGLAVDPVGGRLYWGNEDDGTIGFARLDGTGGGGTLTTGGTAPTGAFQIAVDPVGRRLYGVTASGAIASSNLDGSDARTVVANDVRVNFRGGFALDLAAGRIYWPVSAAAGGQNEGISFASLDGNGGVQALNIAGATLDLQEYPNGVAVDTAAGRAYWADVPCCATTGGRISFANLNGSGGGDLNTAGATVARPSGIAVDHAAGRLYWASISRDGPKISFARLDGSGGGDLNTVGAPVDGASSPVLVLDPRAVASPLVTSADGLRLACSQGSWAPDDVGARLYVAPRGFSYRWTRDRRPIAGATRSTLRASAAGDYRCQVTATNVAGATTQASRPYVPRILGSRTKLTLGLATARIPVRGPLAVRVANANGFAVTGTLAARTTKRLSGRHGRVVELHAVRFTVAAHARKTLKLRLPLPLQRVLGMQHKLSLTLSVAVTDLLHHRRTVAKAVAPRLATAKPPRR
jgi:DNA-binding beta-propeller fold protein YncE